MLTKQAPEQAPEQAPAGTFFHAISEGDLEQVKRCVEQGADINRWIQYHKTSQRFPFFFTPLYITAEKGHLDIVRWLLKNVANINQQSWYGSALYGAVSNGNPEVVRLLVLYGVRDARVPENPETRPWRELGECLRASQRELASAGTVSDVTRSRWEALHTGKPELYFELAELSPHLHSQASTCFGAYPDACWGKQAGIFAFSPMSAPKIPAIRRAAMDYLKAQEKSFASGVELSEAINNVLRENVHRIPDGSWELGALAPYWENYKTEPGDHLGTLVQLWGLLPRESRENFEYLDDYRGERLSVFLGKVQQLKQECAQDWVMASCGLPGEWCPDTLTVYEQPLVLRLQDCQYVTEFARAVIFNQEFSWDALQIEIKALKAFPEYPLSKDLQYFFSDFLKGMWELDKGGCFEVLDSRQKAMLRALARHAGCPQLQFPLSESKPEEPDEVKSFALETAEGFDEETVAIDQYWPALRWALSDAAEPKTDRAPLTLVYDTRTSKGRAESKESEEKPVNSSRPDFL